MQNLPFSLFRQPNSPYFSVSFTVDGIRIRKSLRETDQKRALDKAYRVFYEATVKSESGIDPRPRTVDALIKEFLATPLGKKHDKPALTRYMAEFFAKQPPRVIDETKLEELIEFRKTYWTTGPGKKDGGLKTTRRGKEYLFTIGTKKEPSANTIRIDMISVYAFLEYLKNKKYITYVPKVKLKVSANPRPSFSEIEIEQVKAQLMKNIHDARSQQDRDKNAMFFYFVRFILSSGCRPLELKNIRWQDIHGYDKNGDIGDDQQITMRIVGKGMSRTMVPQPAIISTLDGLYTLFEGHFGAPPAPGDYLFFGWNGGPRKQLFRKLFNKVMDQLNLKYDYRGELRSSYSFRHFFITRMLALGVEPYALARNLGTSPQQLLKHYDHNTIEKYRAQLIPNVNKIKS